jgi:rsbT co-antagonist protein RsbR
MSTSDGIESADIEALQQRIAELEQTCAELLDRAAWLEVLFQRAQIGLTTATPEGKVMRTNPAFQAIVGYSGEELQGMSFEELTHPDDLIMEIKLLEELLQGERETYQVEKRCIHKDRHLVWVHIKISLLLDDTRQPVMVIASVEDITGRKQMEHDIQMGQERLQLVLEATENGIWDWHVPSGEVYYSPRWLGMLGYAPDELAGRVETWEQLLHPEDKPRALDIVGQHMQPNSPPFELEFRMRTKDEGWLWILARGKIVEHDEQGQPVRMLGTHADINERKQQEEELRIFKALVDNALDGIVFTSMDAVIRYANPAFRRLSGFGDQAMNTKVLEFYPSETRPMIEQEIVPAIVGHGAWEGMLELQRPDGGRWPALHSAFVVKDDYGEILVLGNILRDVTDQQSQEQERIALQEQVIEAQRSTLRELSAPLLPISNHTVILPLIGTVDTQRAQQIMETLLEGVAHHQADVAIVDITGVQVIDTQVANALIQAAQAVRLLGAQVVLTGIGPTMAQTLIHLGADLSTIVTRGSLQNGIAYALNR